MTSPVSITVAAGDGVGPEIMEAALAMLQEAGAGLEIETVELGEKADAEAEGRARESVRRTRVLFKGPLGVGADGRDSAAALRRALGLYANVRPCLSYHPYVGTKHPRMDLVVVRGIEEAGPEYRQGSDTAHDARVVSRPESERLVRYAFAYAQAQGRKKVSCFVNDAARPLTDGLFRQVFEEIGTRYPEIEKEYRPVEIGVAKVAAAPERFDVIVLPAFYGDILSDLAAQIGGSVGMVGSSSIGAAHAMFEAIHGPAPRRAGQNVANPSGLFLSGVRMLAHLGQIEAAGRAHNAWLKAIEDGVHTADIFEEGISKQKVGTKEFAKAVIERLGQVPLKLKPVAYKAEAVATETEYQRPVEVRRLVGVDVMMAADGSPEETARTLQALEADGLKLEAICDRGLAVWPGSAEAEADMFRADSWCVRFKLPDEATGTVPQTAVAALLGRLAEAKIEFLGMELLYQFDGKAGFSKGCGS